MRHHRWWPLWALLLSLVHAPGLAAGRDPLTHFFDENFGNLPEEVATARKEGKQAILFMFETADCPWCDKMMKTVLNQPAVQDYYRQHFRILQIDANGDVAMVDFSGKEMSQKDFAFKHNRVRATPVFAFFGLDGQPLTRFTGATKDVEEFLLLGEYVASGAYGRVKFDVYKRDQRRGKKE